MVARWYYVCMNTINRCSIRFHRARALGGKPRTLAVIHTQQGNLVRWRRIVLPAGVEAVQATQHVLAVALRMIGQEGDLPRREGSAENAARKNLELTELKSGQEITLGPDKPRGGC